MLQKIISKGIAKHKASNFQEARKYYLKAIQSYPHHHAGYHLLGTLYAEKNMYEQALTYLKKALMIDKKNSDSISNIANIYLLQNQLDKAAKMFIEAISINPACVSSVFGLGEVYFRKNKDINEAINQYDKALRLSPNSPEINQSMGAALLKKGMFPEALPHLKAAENVKPNLKGLQALLSEAYLRLGDNANSLLHNEKALQYDKNDVSLLYHNHILRGLRPDSELQKKYAELLFDKYSDEFETSLLDKLEYKTPFLIKEIVLGLCREPIDSLLDLGCGTGLVGEAFNNVIGTIDGIDISSKMLEKAKGKKCYRELLHGDLTETLEKIENKYDLVIAADVFVYLGDLDKIFSVVKNVLGMRSFFVFSVELCDKDFLLQSNGRFAHSDEYIKSLVKKYQFSIIIENKCNLRKEMNTWVNGMMYILKK